MFKIIKEEVNNYPIIRVIGEQEGIKTIEVWVNPNDGMNVCKVMVGEHTIVDWNLERCKQGATYGIPLLYPTPNRVANNVFIFEEQEYPMTMHGMANHAEFKVEDCRVLGDEVEIQGRLKFEPNTLAYEKFPFKSELILKVKVSHIAITISYEIVNQDEKVLPYGIALHPFFNKLGKTKIKTLAKYVMEMTDEKLPTGKVIEARGTNYDLENYVEVDRLNLDHVYTGIESCPQAEIRYEEIGLKVELESSKEFTHLVVFTPVNQSFFCIENQSCSTDAHNMYHRGYERLSGLEKIAPHESAKGYIAYKFSYM